MIHNKIYFTECSHRFKNKHGVDFLSRTILSSTSNVEFSNYVNFSDDLNDCLLKTAFVLQILDTHSDIQ